MYVVASEMRFVVPSRSAVGVNVPVQVTPPSLELTSVSVPPATVRSAFVKPATASLKVIVTVVVSPIFSAVSKSVIVAVGALVSIA